MSWKGGLRSLSAAADAFDPDIPSHENPAYVEVTKRYLDLYEQVMRGNAEAFGSRIDRGWMPPSPDDVEAEAAAGQEKT